jgi:predicted DNA-binding protein
MSTKRVNFRIPEELIEKADVAAELTHRNRTELVTEALRAYLDGIEDEESFRQDLVTKYLDGQIGYETLEAFLGRQDAEAVRASREVLDEGEEMAERMADL